MPERSVSLCSHLQKGGKISKEKLHELLLPLTTKQTVFPTASPLFGEMIDPSALPIQEDILLEHSCLLPPSSTHQKLKTGYEDMSFWRVYAVYNKSYLIVGRQKT